MRLWVFSDLHLEFAPMQTPLVVPDADVCVVAGDILHGGPARSVAWLAEHVAPHMPVVFVAGNHEFYQSSIVEGVFEGVKAAAARPNVHFLENGYVEIGGVYFAGATLWTDFSIMGSQDLAMWHAEQVMSDYSAIAYTKKPFSKLRAHNTVRMHRASRGFLEVFLNEHRDRKTVVVTHHAPSPQAIAPQYAHELATAAFVTDMEDLIREGGPTLWVHGHVHEHFEYRVGNTKVVCHPRGYSGEASFGRFAASLIVEI
jgi:Icc-related predicted phosphoesterase